MSRFEKWPMMLRLLLFCTLGVGLYLSVTSGYLIAKAELAQFLLGRSWAIAQQDQQRQAIKPWPWADMYPIAKISIPELDWSAIILEGTSGEALAFGPGHWRESVRPGTHGNSVVAGHRESHFNILKLLHVGDVLHVERRDGRVVSYAVNSVNIVHETDLSVLNDSSETKLTLITCYPVDSVTAGGELRLAITAVAALRGNTVWSGTGATSNTVVGQI